MENIQNNWLQIPKIDLEQRPTINDFLSELGLAGFNMICRQILNILFDKYPPDLTETELKLLLIITRQKYGWTDKRTGKRKARDRISHGQFSQKTGISKKAITTAFKNLLEKGLFSRTNHFGNFVSTVEARRGKILLFYSFTIQSVL